MLPLRFNINNYVLCGVNEVACLQATLVHLEHQVDMDLKELKETLELEETEERRDKKEREVHYQLDFV